MKNDNKPVLLYVDDEEPNLFLFRITFEDDFHTLTAQSGTKGLKILQETDDIDVVISDMRMPVMNGLEFIEKVKAINPNLPCLILSGYERNLEMVEAIENKTIVEYFMKPFDKTTLSQFLMDLCDK